MVDYFKEYEPILNALFVFALIAGVFGLYSSHPSVQAYAVINLPRASYIKAFGGFIIAFALLFTIILILVFKNKKENN